MSTGTRNSILELRNATVRFEMERGESRVLDNVDIDVRRGEVLGIVGESGSGKSMCASAMLNAVVDPGILSGEVIYYPEDGEPIDLMEIDEEELKSLRWEEISFLVQAAQSAFNPTMTIRDHFRETIEAHDADMEEGLDHARDLLSELYLSPELVFQSYPHELSGGMKQRALIALSLVLEPKILVMDEPTSALDLLMQRSIISLLSNIKQEYDLTMVFVTHDLPIVSDVADRLAVMYAFEFVEIGPTDEIQHDPAHPYTRALLKSVPSLTAPVSEMRPISGSSPDPVNVPRGCSYHPRCPLSDDQCVDNDPGFFDVNPEHDVKCFYWEQAANAIPLSSEDGGETVGEES